MTQIPFNLIIPFKDNKGTGLDSYSRQLQKFHDMLLRRGEQLRTDLVEYLDDDFAMTLNLRKTKSASLFLWRFRSTKKSRTQTRLNDPAKIEYLHTLHPAHLQYVLGTEEEILLVNANLGLTTNLRSHIEDYRSSRFEYREIEGRLTRAGDDHSESY